MFQSFKDVIPRNIFAQNGFKRCVETFEKGPLEVLNKMLIAAKAAPKTMTGTVKAMTASLAKTIDVSKREAKERICKLSVQIKNRFQNIATRCRVFNSQFARIACQKG